MTDKYLDYSTLVGREFMTLKRSLFFNEGEIIVMKEMGARDCIYASRKGNTAVYAVHTTILNLLPEAPDKTPFSTHIDWTKIPDWVERVAMDKDGTLHQYESVHIEPHKSDWVFRAGHGGVRFDLIDNLNPTQIKEPWDECIMGRPESLGQVMVDLIPKLYDTQGTIRILGPENTEVINPTFIDQDKFQVTAPNIELEPESPIPPLIKGWDQCRWFRDDEQTFNMRPKSFSGPQLLLRMKEANRTDRHHHSLYNEAYYNEGWLSPGKVFYRRGEV